MKIDVTACPKGFSAIAILKVLADQSTKENPITCDRIAEILKNEGNDTPEYEFPVERKSVERQVKQLKHVGFPIQGVENIPQVRRD